MRRKDERAVRRDPQALKHRYALVHQHLAFGHQCVERKHDAVADVAAHLLAEDARRNERKDGLVAADHQCVAGVVTALKAGHRGGALGQQINNLAFAFIAPLRADDDDELPHTIP